MAENVSTNAAPKAGGVIGVLQNTKTNVNKVSSGKSTAVGNKGHRSGAASTAVSTVVTPGKSTLKEKEKKGQFSASSTQQYSDEKMAGDEDINDVAAMGGVNLAEESQRILGSTEMIGTQIRSCKEEYLLSQQEMQLRVNTIAARYDLGESTPEVASLVTHAVEERLKTIIEKLAVIAQHRVESELEMDSRYELTHDVKAQLKFLEEVDRLEMKRRENAEREMLLRAAKSRSKNDPEKAKLKAKAKEMQRAELEELRQRDANSTALQAIGPRKRPRLDGASTSGASTSGASTSGASTSDASTADASTSAAGPSGRSQPRRRVKRVHQRDFIYCLENDRDTAHSVFLYKSYLK